MIAALDVELCDCFLDYGEASAEMFLLLTFVAFGAGLIWTGFTVADGRTLLFAGIALVVRTAVLLPVLERAGIATRDCRLIAWFGPRGLSSLLLVLLPVFAGVPGSERLFQITCLVVLLSVLLHGGGIAFYLGRLARAASSAGTPSGPAQAATRSASPQPRPEARPSEPRPTEPRPRKPRRTELQSSEPGSSESQPSKPEAQLPERITLEEYKRLREQGEPILVLDVRTERSYRDDPNRAAGSLRLPPDDAVRLARERRLDPDSTLVLYCT